MYTVSQKNCAELFLSELRQIFTDCNNFWQIDGKMSEILRGVFIYVASIKYNQAIQCSQQVGLLVTSSCPVFDLKFSVERSRSVGPNFSVLGDQNRVLFQRHHSAPSTQSGQETDQAYSTAAETRTGHIVWHNYELTQSHLEVYS